MKKLIAILLVITTVFALFGCENAQHTPKGAAEKIVNNLINGNIDSVLNCYAFLNADIRSEYGDKGLTDIETLNAMLCCATFEYTEFELGEVTFLNPDEVEYKKRLTAFYETAEKYGYSPKIVSDVEGIAYIMCTGYEEDIVTLKFTFTFFKINGKWYEGTNAFLISHYPQLFPS